MKLGVITTYVKTVSFFEALSQPTFAASHLTTHWRRQPTKDVVDVNARLQ